MNLTFYVEIALEILLAATLCYCIVLERRLAAVRKGQEPAKRLEAKAAKLAAAEKAKATKARATKAKATKPAARKPAGKKA